MFKEKVKVKKIFDDKILKPGTKVFARHRSYISDSIKSSWDEEINGEIVYCSENFLTIKNLEDGEFDDYSEHWYSYHYNIKVNDIDMGFWEVKLI